MPQEASAIRWRTVIEIAIISLVIYVLIGTPGMSTLTTAQPEDTTPKARAKVENLVYPRRDLQCSQHEHQIHILATNPLVMYIDDFVSNTEADHLVDISENKWQVSTVFNEGEESRDDSIRKSEKALIDRDDTVQCIEQRALSIQGWPQETFIERLWTQRYNTSGHYAHHYDWATANKQSRRVSTFMVYLSADCTGGGTNFPRLSMPHDEKWCEYIECPAGQDGTQGVTFKPKKGAAVYWENFDANGIGYKETIHAGMPVKTGTKIGLNIWTWFQAGHVAEE